METEIGTEMCKKVRDRARLMGEERIGGASVTCSEERTEAVKKVLWQRYFLAEKRRRKQRLQFGKDCGESTSWSYRVALNEKKE